MSKKEDSKYQEKITRKIKTIESVIEDLSENEISAAICAAITWVLFNKGLCTLEVKRFYAELATAAIEHTELAYKIYKLGGKDDTN